MNKVILIGRVGRDPEATNSKTGTLMVNLSLATTEKVKGMEHTEWHKILLFDKTAQVVADYVKKGSQIMIEGKIRTEAWEKDGVKRYTTTILGNSVELLGSKDKGKETATTEKNIDNNVSSVVESVRKFDDDDIPF